MSSDEISPEPDDAERSQDTPIAISLALGWTLVVALPSLAVMGASLYKMVWAEGLPSYQRPIPDADWWATLGPLLGGLAHAGATGVIAAIGDRFIRARPTRNALFAFLAVFEIPLLLAGVLAGGIGAIGLSEPRPLERLRDPTGQRRAFLYEYVDERYCGWEIYTAGATDLVSTRFTKTVCDCVGMPSAKLGWQAGDPVLTDLSGATYSCPYTPPRSAGCNSSGCNNGQGCNGRPNPFFPGCRCSVGGGPLTWPALLVAWALVRRRRIS